MAEGKFKKPQTRELAIIHEGKLPPQVPDLEEAVLGALILEKNSIQNVLDILVPECFYVDAHQEIFRIARFMYSNGQPMDILTLTEELKKQGKLEVVGGPYYITKLTSRVSSAANLMYHSMIIIEKYMLREFIKIAGELGRMAFDYDANPWDIKDDISNKLMILTDVSGGKTAKHISETIDETRKLLDHTVSEYRDDTKSSKLTGIPTGFTEVDKATKGWQKTDLIIIAARPGMGKTAFVLNTGITAAQQNKAVLLFSLEMDHIQLVQRIESSESGIPLEAIKDGSIGDNQFEYFGNSLAKLYDIPFWIDDRPNLSIQMIEAQARKFKKQKNIELIIIDYMQLIKSKVNGNREAEISDISRRLKQLAKELDIPIIALAQLSREVEKRADKRPILSDLRESGSIEQDADIIAFIYRFEYYFPKDVDIDTDINGKMYSPKNLAEFIIAKFRNGGVRSIPLKFYGWKMKFIDHEEEFEDVIEEVEEYNPIIPAPDIISSSEEEDDLPF